MTRTRASLLARAAMILAAAATSAQPARENIIGAVLAAARAQIGRTVIYDGSYKQIAYPGGDVPLERGVCTDVLVRAFRAAGVDLQKLVHEDMESAFGAYPKTWGLSRPDANIDHRRVPNLAVFFKRHGISLRPSGKPADYLPGDIVTWLLPSGYPHIGLVSDRWSDGRERPLVIHNIGEGTKEEDVLFAYNITGHYRYFLQRREGR